MERVCFRLLWAIAVAIVTAPFLSAQQCANDLPSDVTVNWNSASSPEVNFNAARRAEEVLLGLGYGTLGYMSAPAAGWSALSDGAAALYIHNSERLARGCSPLYGVETTLSGVASAHSAWQAINGVFSHSGDPVYGSGWGYQICNNNNVYSGSMFWDRIEASATGGCWEWIGENLGVIVAPSSNHPALNHPIAQVMYLWIYQDALSSWGHRKAVFHAYTDNYGATGSEGFIGVGNITGNNFTARVFGCATWNTAKIITIDYFDAQSSAPCSFNFSAVLPVELLSFECEKQKDDSEVRWETALEKGLSHFSVERSTDGVHFETIGNLPAEGDHEGRKQYHWMDYSPFKGPNFYRLAMVDMDGSVSYSRIKLVRHDQSYPIAITPNPATRYFRVTMPDREDLALEVIIYNTLGVAVRHIADRAPNTELPLDGLAKGGYWVQVRSEDGLLLTQKIIVE